MELLNVTQLHADLMAVSDGTKSEAFFFKDFERDGVWYRIFGYHIASYTDFSHPSALEGRGIMFRLGSPGVDGNRSPAEIVCLPPKKFFNLYENPFTLNLDPTTLVGVMNKEDGSLISTYLHNGVLSLKSKTSLSSDQVKLAEDFLANTQTGKLLRIKLDVLTKRGYTVNCELVSPLNRIVLAYDTTSLVVLNLRCLKTGKTIFRGDDPEIDKVVGLDWVEEAEVPNQGQQEYIDSIETMEGIEGFVLKFRTEEGILLAKHKTSWYKHLHHNKDSVAIPRRLFECIIDEVVDDLKALFHDDPISMRIITDMEEKVVPKFNHIIHTVEQFYETNKDLVRKDYAIKGQAELGPLFGLSMMKYLGKKVDFKEFAKKNIEMFGVKPEEVVVSE